MNKTPSDSVFLGILIPRTMKNLLTKAVDHDTHMNESELVRDAIREKLTRMGFNLTEGVSQR